MSESEMTSFESRFEQRLQRYATIDVRPVDAAALAHDVAVTAPRQAGLTGRLQALFRAPRLAFGPMTLLIVVGLLLAVLLAFFIGANLLRKTSAPPGRNGLIAYELWDVDTRPYTHLHVMNPDGTGDREIGQGAGPIYAKDGTSLAYSIGYGLGAPEQRLFVADGDGANPRDIAAYEEGGFALAPDGSQFVVNESDGLWLISTDDGSRSLLLPAWDSSAIHRTDLTWSPDSKSIAYSVMEDVTNADNSGMRRLAIDIVDVETQALTRLTSRTGTDGTAIKWSPDGTRIAFLGLPDGSPEPSLGTGGESPDSWWLPEDVFLVNVDGTEERNLTSSEAFELQPEWSPDGVSLAFETFVDPVYKVAIVDTWDPASEVRIGPASVGDYEWSPSGKQLALTRVSDVSPRGAERQSLKSKISVIDAAFETPEETILEADYNVGSLTWQWLAPE